MSSECIIGALAFGTIGAIAVYHFGTFLKDPRKSPRELEDQWLG